MATRLPASQHTREELTALIEGRLSTASAKDELVKLATRSLHCMVWSHGNPHPAARFHIHAMWRVARVATCGPGDARAEASPVAAVHEWLAVAWAVRVEARARLVPAGARCKYSR
jgi:hypothetical protein